MADVNGWERHHPVCYAFVRVFSLSCAQPSKVFGVPDSTMAGAAACSGLSPLGISHDVRVQHDPDRNRKPWKYIGYSGFSSFIASDNDFFVLRRFSAVTVRVLLALQDELSELEGQLTTIDEKLSEPCAPDIHNGSFRQETSELRLELIRELDSKLRAYSKSTSPVAEIKSLTFRRRARTPAHPAQDSAQSP